MNKKIVKISTERKEKNKKEEVTRVGEVINKNIESVFVMTMKTWQIVTFYCPFCYERTTTKMGSIALDDGTIKETELFFCIPCDKYLWVNTVVDNSDMNEK